MAGQCGPPASDLSYPRSSAFICGKRFLLAGWRGAGLAARQAVKKFLPQMNADGGGAGRWSTGARLADSSGGAGRRGAKCDFRAKTLWTGKRSQGGVVWERADGAAADRGGARNTEFRAKTPCNSHRVDRTRMAEGRGRRRGRRVRRSAECEFRARTLCNSQSVYRTWMAEGRGRRRGRRERRSGECEFRAATPCNSQRVYRIGMAESPGRTARTMDAAERGFEIRAATLCNSQRIYRTTMAEGRGRRHGPRVRRNAEC